MAYKKESYYGACWHRFEWARFRVSFEHWETPRRWADRLGFSLWGSAGPEKEGGWNGPGGYIDCHPPLGEPNRIGWHVLGWAVTVGLPSTSTLVPDGTGPGGIPQVRTVHGWRYLHIDGIHRYRYHEEEDGLWHPDARPAPGHWGWLTVERRKPQ